MPKKKQPRRTKKPPRLKTLTNSNYLALARALRGSMQNVYTLAGEMFPGYPWDDANFDRLKAVAGLFRCENCARWLDVKRDEDLATKDWCTKCVNQNSGGSDES